MSKSYLQDYEVLHVESITSGWDKLGLLGVQGVRRKGVHRAP